MKKQYIRDKIHLSELQDKYWERLKNNGYDLERGIKNSDNENIELKVFKKITKKLERDLNVRHERLDNAIEKFNNNMKDSKSVLFDKDYVKVKKETFESMNNIIEETNGLIKVQEKVEQVFYEIDSQVKSYNTLKKENTKLKNEVKNLEDKNDKLQSENNKLITFITNLLERLKKVFRKLLLFGDKESKDIVSNQIKDLYDNDRYETSDVYFISHGTDKEDELFEYADIPDYYRTRTTKHEKNDDFDMSL